LVNKEGKSLGGGQPKNRRTKLADRLPPENEDITGPQKFMKQKLDGGPNYARETRNGGPQSSAREVSTDVNTRVVRARVKARGGIETGEGGRS